MLKPWLPLALASVAAADAANVTTASPPVPPDPVGPYDFPDPAAAWDGRQFHAYGGAMTMSSTDLRHWGARPDYLAHSPAWAHPGAGGGAPSPAVRLGGGDWMIYFQANPRDCERPPCGCIGAAKSDSAGGPFVPTIEPVVCMPEEHGLVDGSARRIALGADVATVLYFKSTGFNTLARPARLWAVVLTDDGARLKGAPVNLLNQTATWEARNGIGCIEAPAMLVQQQQQQQQQPAGKGKDATASARFTLFYSGGDWTAGLDGVPYSVGYASCASALGPCVKRTTHKPWFGPAFKDAVGVGGQEVFTDGDGQVWMVFHGWAKGKAGYGNGGERTVRFHPLSEIEQLAGPLQPYDQQ